MSRTDICTKDIGGREICIWRYAVAFPASHKTGGVRDMPYLNLTCSCAGSCDPPPPVLDAKGRKEYYIENIVDQRWNEKKNRMEYWVKWAGYCEAHNTWESRGRIIRSPETWLIYPCTYDSFLEGLWVVILLWKQLSVFWVSIRIVMAYKATLHFQAIKWWELLWKDDRPKVSHSTYH